MHRRLRTYEEDEDEDEEEGEDTEGGEAQGGI